LLINSNWNYVYIILASLNNVFIKFIAFYCVFFGVKTKTKSFMQILCKSLTSVIGSAGFGWSGDSCFFVGDVGIFCVTGVAKPCWEKATTMC